ncbi:hypothetical protein [Thiolapillus sp.]|uniref:hypothetical protein n=1 Tax=Thiolapillus sp. TaxID=2017437 RepID=UPI003AF6C8CC
MKIEMTEAELAQHLAINTNLLQVLYRYLNTDIVAISAADGFCPPVLRADYIVSSCTNISESIDELGRVAEAAVAIIELLDSLREVLANPTQTAETEKPENTNE